MQVFGFIECLIFFFHKWFERMHYKPARAYIPTSDN